MEIKNLCINTMRTLSADAIQKAKSGHPGLPLGASPMAFTLFNDCMKISPKNPNWFDRDRFILSAGHGSMLLYSLLHLFDYGVSIDDIKNFRQIDSLTPGHPEYGHTAGIDATTGPLGQGISMAVGMALAESHLASIFNTDDCKLVDHYTYSIVGDGCLMEGISNEASSLAGTLKLGKLIVLYDSNNITIEGDTSTAFGENVRARYEALGWETYFVADGNNINEIKEAIERAKLTDKPSLIEIKTKIGYGSTKEGSASAHGEPLGEDNIPTFKKNIGWEYEESFYVPEEVKKYMKEVVDRKNTSVDEWEKLLEEYKVKYPEKYDLFQKFIKDEIDEEILNNPSIVEFEKDMASRESSGIVLNRFSKLLPNLFGGSADLGPSNKSTMSEYEFYSPENRSGKNIHFGVREHAMAAICNGISLHRGLLPYCATFFVFSDYLKPAVRLSALMNQGVIYVLTHDSIGVGEDGPTHEPIEHLAMFRSTPNVSMYRPCDAKETAYAWISALKNRKTPSCLALTRQKLTNLEETSSEALKGGYVLKDFGNDFEVIIMASGSEVGLAYKVCEKLLEENISTRLVSMPCMEEFEKQSKEYKEKVLPNNIRKRVSIEALSTFGWGKYVGLDGISIGLDTFGASAPANLLFEKFGFTVDAVYDKIKKELF